MPRWSKTSRSRVRERGREHLGEVGGERQRGLARAAGEGRRPPAAVGLAAARTRLALQRHGRGPARAPPRSSGTASAPHAKPVGRRTARSAIAARRGRRRGGRRRERRAGTPERRRGGAGAHRGHASAATRVVARPQVGSGRMTHHREPVTALGAPAAVGPYSHAVRAGGLLFCSGQVAAGPRERRARRRHVGEQARRCLENLRRSAPRPAPTLADAVRCTRLRHRHGDVRRGQRGLRRRSSRPTRRRASTVGVAALPQGRRRSRSTRSSRSREADDRGATRSPRTTSRARGRRSPTSSRHTPVLPARRSPSAAAREVVLKAESLQRTGSFKIRGALSKLAALGDGCAARRDRRQRRQPRLGAGARRPRARRAVRGLHAGRGAAGEGRGRRRARGARAAVAGDSVEECARRARASARARPAWPSCTRSTTPTSSPARARSGSSCSRTSPDLAKVVVPVGGGGLAAGVAIAVKSARPDVEVVGVQVDAVAAFPRLAGAGGAGRRRPRR